MELSWSMMMMMMMMVMVIRPDKEEEEVFERDGGGPGGSIFYVSLMDWITTLVGLNVIKIWSGWKSFNKIWEHKTKVQLFSLSELAKCHTALDSKFSISCDEE